MLRDAGYEVKDLEEVHSQVTDEEVNKAIEIIRRKNALEKERRAAARPIFEDNPERNRELFDLADKYRVQIHKLN